MVSRSENAHFYGKAKMLDQKAIALELRADCAMGIDATVFWLTR